MNIFSFLGLLNEIFIKKKPNIVKIQKKGLLAVKIAQTFALRIDFLDETKCRELSKLFANVEKIPPEGVDALLNHYKVECNGMNLIDNFRTFNREAFASASVGQVHLGILKTGEKVAVKLIKGDFKNRFEKDVESVQRLLKWVIRFYPKLAKVADPVGILNSIKKFTLDELDLRNELAHRNKLFDIYIENNTKFDLSRLKFINIYNKYINKNVMVSDFIDGETFDKLLTKGKLPYNTVLEFFHIHGFYIFCIGIFHGDIHPGNIILKGEDIYFVDCGAMGNLTEKLRKGLFNFMEALSIYNFIECANHLNSISEVVLEGDEYKRFEEKFLKLYDGFENATVSQVSLTRKMMETIKLGVNSGMNFEQGMFPVIKSLMYLDGMVLRCNPNAILMKDLRRYIKEFKPFL